MATNLVFNFIGNNKLSKTTAVMGNDIKKLGAVAENVGKKMDKALGAVGLGVSFTAIKNFYTEAAKAAVADAKSQDILAQSLKNTVGANSAAIKGAEKWIQKTSTLTATFDDELRPALATATQATGSITKGQRLVALALDISAAKSLDLKTVTNALSKAQDGNVGALKKLIPGLKTTGNVMGELEKQYQGMAQLNAEKDPFKRMAVIVDNLKEEIGAGLVPAMQDFSNYLASPEGERNLKQVAQVLGSIASAIGNVIRFLVENINLVKAVLAIWLEVRTAIFLATTAMKLYDLATKIATISTRTLKFALIGTGIGAFIVLVGTLAEAYMTATQKADEFYDATIQQSQAFQDALDATGDATVEINEQLGQIFKDGKLIFDQATFDRATADAEAAIQASKDRIVRSAEKFRDSVGLAFGVTGKDEFAIFNMDKAMAKLERMVNAARGFGSNIQKLVKAGAGQDVINELIAMGPAQGNIVAKGLLASGQLSEYIGLRQSLYNLGTNVQTQAESAAASYTFNIKSDMSAQDIVTLIQQYEKKTKKKYFVG